jgi:hypothetical protein
MQRRPDETMLRDPGPQQIELLAKAAPGTRCTFMKLTRRRCRWPTKARERQFNEARWSF